MPKWNCPCCGEDNDLTAEHYLFADPQEAVLTCGFCKTAFRLDFFEVRDA